MALMIEEDLRDETTKVKIEENKIILVNKNIDFKNADGNFIGMMKCSKYYKEDFFQAIEDLADDNSQAYYTIGIEKMIKDGKRVNFETRVQNACQFTDARFNGTVFPVRTIT